MSVTPIAAVRKAGARVAILGAAGGIGQPLALLLKSTPTIGKLSLYDLANTHGIATDLSHISTPALVKGYTGPEQLDEALKDMDIVVIPAGVARKPGMTRDDLFNINAGIVKNLAEAAARVCPKAFLAVIANPVNSTVPIVSEVFKKAGVYDPKRIFGVTTLDSVRAETFISELKGYQNNFRVEVYGGHSGPTIVPRFSSNNYKFTDEELNALTQRIQYGGDEVVKAKNGAGSATLSMAYAGARFTQSLINGAFLGKPTREWAFIKSSAHPEAEYFASPFTVGKNGVETIEPLPKFTEYEKKLLAAAIPDLKKNIAKGVNFVKGA